MSIEIIPFLYQDSKMPINVNIFEKWLEDDDILEIAPQIYCILQEKGKFSQTPLFFQEKVKEQFKQSLFQNVFIQNQTKVIIEAFDSLGIDVIPLKGVMFARKYFHHIGARRTSDIDLLIKLDSLEKAVECVKRLGFSCQEEAIKGHFHISFSKLLPESEIPLTIELHWDILPDKTSALKIEEFWEESLVVNPYVHVYELSDYHTFYMICLHSWRHNLDSLKHIIDIVHLIDFFKEEIDYERLMKDGARHKTFNRLERTLTNIYQECTFLEEIKPFTYKKSGTILGYEARKRQHGHRLSHYLDFIDYRILSYDTTTHRVRELVKWVTSGR